MRGNLPQNEPKKYKQWDDENMYDKMKDNIYDYAIDNFGAYY